jgi:hypothetical protein
MRYDPLQSFGWWVSHNGPLLKPFERMRSGTPVTNPHRNLLPRIHLRHRFKQVQHPAPPHTHTHTIALMFCLVHILCPITIVFEKYDYTYFR